MDTQDDIRSPEGYRKVKRTSVFVTFNTPGERSDGALMEPVMLPDPDGQDRRRFHLEQRDGRILTLPADTDLISQLEDVFANHGAGVEVVIIFTHTMPSKKGSPRKMFDVYVPLALFDTPALATAENGRSG